MRQFVPAAILFLNGFAIMSLELLGSRVVAPYLGTTVEVWSSLIAVVLGAVGVGYYLGGRVADTFLDRRAFALLCGAGAALVACATLLRKPLLAYVALALPYGVAAFLSALFLFALPAMVLGAVTTYVIRLQTNTLEALGRTHGTLYGISTLGSIAGVFITSIYLVPAVSVSTVLLILSCALAVNAGLALFPNSFVGARGYGG